MYLTINDKQVIILYNAMKIYVKKYVKKNRVCLGKVNYKHFLFEYYNDCNKVKKIYNALKKEYKNIINNKKKGGNSYDNN